MSDVCELHEVYGCTICSGKDRDDRRARSEVSRPFEAKYPGTCPRCLDVILTGDMICMTSGNAVHEECA